MGRSLSPVLAKCANRNASAIELSNGQDVRSFDDLTLVSRTELSFLPPWRSPWERRGGHVGCQGVLKVKEIGDLARVNASWRAASP